jgi:hypothetical protein
MRICVVLDLLAAIRKRNDKFVIVTVCLAPDFVQQPRVASLEKPDHAACSIGSGALVLEPGGV